MALTSKKSEHVSNWQAGKTVTDCNLHMLTSEDCSDVTFRVGSEKCVVRAHRYVLVSRSCVFHTMFCGTKSKKGEVTIPDVELSVFKEFLRYLYTDTATLTADNVTGLLCTSRKYAVDALQAMCVTFLETSLSEENVCQILELCHGYGESDLEQKALKILTEAGMNIIKNPGFLELCSDCLEKFLKSANLNLKEEAVVEAVNSWAKAKCNKDGVSSSPKNLKKVLGRIGFPVEYMENVVSSSGFLNNKERVNISKRTSDASADISPFKPRPKKSRRDDTPELESSNRYVSRYSILGYVNWCSVGKPQAVSFTASKNISLVGCQLYGPYLKSECKYKLNITLYDDEDEVIAQPLHKTTLKLTGNLKPNDLMFPDPVALEAGRTYTICVTMSGEVTDWGYGGQSSVTEDGVTFTFSDSKHSTDTNVKIGQIPGLIWK